MQEQLIVIRTLADMTKLEEYLSDKNYVAFDIETTGIERDSEIIGFSVSAEVEIGYYVILSEWSVAENKLISLETREGAKRFVSDLTAKSLIMQNAGFDCGMVLSNYGVDLMPALHTDTMILAHVLDENRAVGLKELGVALYGADAKLEQQLMKESVAKNGGMLTKANYELYKADSELIARYGAKDAILTLKIFYTFVEELFEQGLDAFFYEDESMPLLRGPTYDLNNTGLRVDPEKLQKLRLTLESECLEAKSFIYKEIAPFVKDKYPGTKKTNQFNIGSSKQLSWLMFFRLENEFHTLTEEGRALCKHFDLRLPYAFKDKGAFIDACVKHKDREWKPESWVVKVDKEGNRSYWNPDTRRVVQKLKKVTDPWNYLACGKETLSRYAEKYKWVSKLLEYTKNQKILNTYVEGIQSKMRYNIIHPGFLQHGTTSGRYSSRRPNFQNLPRDDKRVKACIVSRPGNVFVGADYSQLEPRVFASFAQDERLMNCFRNGDDFYSVIGAEVFNKAGYSLKKDDKNSFAKEFPALRQVAKTIALAATYGTTAVKMAPLIGKSIPEAQEVIDSYFESFPSVQALMLESHGMAKKDGRVVNLFGRPRRMPEAKKIPKVYGNTSHERLPYQARNLLNLAVNHRIQSTGASIMNRAAIAVWKTCRLLAQSDPLWKDVKLVLQVHDELILEGPEALSDHMVTVLKRAMEDTVVLPGVELYAEPKVANNLADLK